ncbi:MAG: outer membrane lipoprotein-sorting protein [Pseudomonadota bacterium]
MKNLFITTIVSSFLLFTAIVANADEALEKGFFIAERSDKTDRGFGSQRAFLTMTLTTRSGQSTTREMQIDTLEKFEEGSGDWSITQFFSPPDVEGTALLSQAKILESDNQWLFLPGLNRVKRISSSNKSGPFVGSEFAFEDLTANELGKYDYRYIETKMIDGMEMDILECTPRYERSGYSRLLCYFDTDIYQSRKIEFFDRGGQKLKTLTLENYNQYEDKYWRASFQRMVNHLTGKSTVLAFENYEFGVELSRLDFEPEALERL